MDADCYLKDMHGNPIGNVSTNPIYVLAGTKALADGKTRVSSTPYGYDVTEGNLSGHTPFFKTGYNPDVDAAEEELWSVGGSYVFPASGQQMELTSSSTLDSTTGTGAKTVKIWYLDSALAEKEETVTMDGTNIVPTTATNIYRINAFRVMTAGTTGAAAGNIDIRNLADTPIYSRISAGKTRARNSIYTVPVSKTLYITQLTFSIINSSGGRSGIMTLRATYDDKIQAVSTLFYPYFEIGAQDSSVVMNLDFPIKFPAGTDIKLSVIGDATNADAVCTGSYRGWLE
jgi:hypothetical protein